MPAPRLFAIVSDFSAIGKSNDPSVRMNLSASTAFQPFVKQPPVSHQYLLGKVFRDQFSQFFVVSYPFCKSVESKTYALFANYFAR